MNASLGGQTEWLFVGAVICCAVLVLVVHQFRVYQRTRRLRVRLDDRLAERTRIAQELHDTLLQGFLSASVYVHFAADGLPPDSQVKPTLTRAIGLMGQVIEEGRHAILGLRSSYGVLLDLKEAFSLVQDEVAPTDINQRTGFCIIVDGQSRPLHPVLHDEVYRIGREALINAFRHAKASRIELMLRYSSNRLRLVVRDDGCGIDPEVLEFGREGHWGLLGLQERADRIGAQLNVISSKSGGTEIDLSVPGHIAFHNKASRSVDRLTAPIFRAVRMCRGVCRRRVLSPL